jgi:hypothetical protein
MEPNQPDYPGRGGSDEDEDFVTGESSQAAVGSAIPGPLVCAFKGLGDAFAGAVMGSVFGFGTSSSCFIKTSGLSPG